MSLIRAQIRMQYFTGLPEDVISNTLYFVTPTPWVTADLTEITGRIGAFIAPFDQQLSVQLKRSPGVSINYYDMADAEPRQPLEPGWGFPLPAAVDSGSLPLECAVVLSFHSAFIAGVPNARRRGRIYLGPWGQNALGSGNATQFPSVAASVRTNILAGAPKLGLQISRPLQWVQYSPTTGEAHPVQGGWVDDEFDTQRRRQSKATSRTLFVV